MREATVNCLRNDFCSDSMAHVRYLLYAQKAKEEGFPSIARLFRALALSRYTRASEQYNLVHELLGTFTVSANTYFTLERTMDNLERARNAEARDANEVLSACLAVAVSQGETAAVKSLKRSAAICNRRAAILDSVFLQTQRVAEEPAIDVYVCRVCGYVTTDVPEDPCPVCDSERSDFITVT